MGKLYRSARGEMVDFDLLAIKAQLAASPPPPTVEARRRAMDAKDGVKTDAQPNLEFMSISLDAAAQSAAAVDSKPRQARQLKQK